MVFRIARFDPSRGGGIIEICPELFEFMNKQNNQQEQNDFDVVLVENGGDFL